ncbi:MAG: glutathione S-transferase [Limisphaerales bacterium]|jgi:glutathione S-transferase
MKLYGVALSPFVRKAMFALEYLGFEYESEATFPGDDSPEFRAISPLGKIPILEHDSFTVADTSVICRYLDRLSNDKSLYPQDPQEEARAGWIEEYADSRLIENCAGVFQERLLKPKMMNQPTDEVRLAALLNEGLPACLNYVETFVPESGYLVGDSLSIADISLVTCFIQAQYADFEVDAKLYPKLRSYLDRAYEDPLVTNRLASEKANLPPGF